VRWDILRFCIDPDHASPEFPAGYWPAGGTPPDPDARDRPVVAFRAALGAMMDLVSDPATDLFSPLPHGQNRTIWHKALPMAGHNTDHLAIATIRSNVQSDHERAMAR
jgi:hypothetical protein